MPSLLLTVARAMLARLRQSRLALLLVALLGIGVSTARAITSAPVEAGSGTVGLRPSAAALPEVTPLTQAAFDDLLRQATDGLRAEAPRHIQRAAEEGVRISRAQYERGLEHLGRTQVLTDAAWQEQMQGEWQRCAMTDACTARFVLQGEPRTLVFIRSSAIPNATTRPVQVPQLLALLEHEFAHVLLMEVGFQGNQDAFITQRWTLGTPDSALSSHVSCPETRVYC